MTDEQDERPPESETPKDLGTGAGRSVLQFLSQKTGEAPRITLRDEDSASVSAPLIDPRSQEKLSVPRGRGVYQFLGEIARGGMGVILKGHDTDLGRDVAVKVLAKGLAGREDVVQRFVEEAQIGGQLQHPGIVPVYELGLMEDERPYFTMKLVKGRTLATLLAEREGPGADRQRLIDIFESVCQTIAYAHSRGVIHRDLKPANIMVGAFGEVQVVDWGLAKVLLRGGTADEKRARVAQSELTILETVRSDGSGTGTDSMVGSVLGTPAYMPPEQASGLVDRLDERADVFALGAILCEILTGLPPYVGDRDEVIGAAAQGELEQAFERLDGCGADAGLIKLARQCLVPAAAARPANAGIVAERVHGYVVSVEERAHAAQVEVAEARVKAIADRKSRNLTLALGAAIVGIVLIGGGGWLFVQNERAASERAEVQRMQLAAQRDRELAGEVNETLNAASAFEGAGNWSEALAAAERARALAEGGGASEELLGSVDAMLATLGESQAAAAKEDERRQDTRLLLAELQEVVEPGEEFSADEAASVLAADYEAIFRAHQLNLDDDAAEDVARTLTERGLGSDVALILDVWAESRRRSLDEEGALRLLEVAHIVDPDPVRAHLREALANRELAELRFLADSDLREQPASTIALLASAFANLKERGPALAVYREGIESYPGDFGLLYGLGRLLTPPELDRGVEGELREALVCYRAALAVDPSNVSVRYYLGRVYSKLGDNERALEQFVTALELRPNHGPYLYHKAGGYLRTGRLEESRALYERTATMDSPRWLRGWSLDGISKCYMESGDRAEALVYARRAIDVEPLNERFLYQVISLGASSGRQEDLEEALRIVDERAANDSEAHNYLAWHLALYGGPEESARDLAVQMAERCVELAPQDGSGWNSVGAARYYAGDHDGAVLAMLESERLGYTGDCSNWLFLAMAYQRLGNEEVARVWYDRAVYWMKGRTGVDSETTRFRAEADALLEER